jgi:hypothetical protein
VSPRKVHGFDERTLRSLGTARLCEERSDEAISSLLNMNLKDCFAALAMTNMPVEQRYFYSRKCAVESYPGYLIYAEMNFETGSRQAWQVCIRFLLQAI